MKIFSLSRHYDISKPLEEALGEFHTESGYKIVHIEKEEKIVFIQPGKTQPRRSVFKKIITAISSLFT
jgi:hypothetical protein